MDSEDYSDRKYLKRRDQGNEHGWQFQFEREPIEASEYFRDSKYGSKTHSYQAAKNHRDAFLKNAYEQGILDPDTPSLRHSIPLVLALSPRNTSGIVGVSREDRPRKDRIKREVSWVANYQDESGKNKQKQFFVARLGEKEALFRAVSFRKDFVQRVAERTTNSIKRVEIEKHLQELDSLFEYIIALEEDADVFFFLGTINNPLLASTTKQEMLNVRIGQQRFRKLVLDMWRHKCAITGATQFITASHIKPWSVSDNFERLDPFNGLPLSPVYDKAFDVGLISFDDEGKILISKHLMHDANLLGISGQERIRELNFMHKKYLAYHRKILFEPNT
ncbi:MAG: HNH endonuclease [Nitrosomonadales bacterium]|nr:HNH endonuclease [Nitrosomonadales bacterium]